MHPDYSSLTCLLVSWGFFFELANYLITYFRPDGAGESVDTGVVDAP
jgi:hypothetical protein